jgi:hypothetical protein
LLTAEAESLNFTDRDQHTRPRYGVFPPVAVLLATLLGGVLAAAFVMAHNYQSQGRRRPMRLAGTLGVLTFFGFFGVLTAWPEIRDYLWLRLALYSTMAPFWVAFSPTFPGFEKTAIFLPPLVTFSLALLLRRGLCDDHLRRGGRRASVWNAAGMSLFCAIFEITGIMLQHSLFPPGGVMPRRLTVASVSFGARRASKGERLPPLGLFVHPFSGAIPACTGGIVSGRICLMTAEPFTLSSATPTRHAGGRSTGD